MSAAVALSAAVSFETPEILSISDETLDGFYTAEPKLERYRRYLWNIRRRKEHVLSLGREALAAAGEMANAPENISIASLPMQTSPSPMRRTARATGIP